MIDSPIESVSSSLFQRVSILVKGGTMLSDKVWVTRKARIIAEKRLVDTNNLANILVIWYSIFLVAFSIWNLLYPDDTVNILLVNGSIAVLVATVALTSQKYSERSLALRYCYLKLDNLYFKIKNAEQNNDDKLLHDLESQYIDTIQHVENHSDFDYLRLRFELRNNTDTTLPKFTRHDWFCFISQWILTKLLIAFIFFLPIGMSILWTSISSHA